MGAPSLLHARYVVCNRFTTGFGQPAITHMVGGPCEHDQAHTVAESPKALVDQKTAHRPHIVVDSPRESVDRASDCTSWSIHHRNLSTDHRAHGGRFSIVVDHTLRSIHHNTWSTSHHTHGGVCLTSRPHSDQFLSNKQKLDSNDTHVHIYMLLEESFVQSQG